MADKKKMSVEEILAAARKDKGGSDTAGASATPPRAVEAAPSSSNKPDSEPAVVSPPAASAAKPATKSKPGSMSVADMLAAARGGGKGAAPAAPETNAPAPKPVAKPKAEPAEPGAPKVAAKAPAKPSPAQTPVADTASILAAARGASKPGPMSKAEAAAKGGVAVAEKSGKKKLDVPPMPAKPAFAKSAEMVEGSGRRGFFAYLGSVILGSSLAFGFASLAVTHLLWALGLARFMFPNILTEPPSRFKVGFPDVLGLGQVDERFKSQFGVWIVKAEYEGQPQIFALKTVCTHLGCTPNWLEAEQKFKCPCHGSGFYKDGVNFEGPAPRPLERYAIRVADDGQLEVDKSRVFHEELGQWKETSSFVTT